ncbi:MAG: hypothetical protein GY906_32435 [bacterium]|nr:hypothetical protein [bacterium]
MTAETSEVSGTQTIAYNEHGQLTQQTDARSVVVDRTVDDLDRVSFVNYPDDSLDITYTYDDPGVDFSLSRLTAISRDSASVDYAYDRLGRALQDGHRDGQDRVGTPAGSGPPSTSSARRSSRRRFPTTPPRPRPELSRAPRGCVRC